MAKANKTGLGELMSDAGNAAHWQARSELVDRIRGLVFEQRQVDSGDLNRLRDIGKQLEAAKAAIRHLDSNEPHQSVPEDDRGATSPYLLGGVSHAEPGLPTDDIASAFNGIYWNFVRWKMNLTDPPKWALKARRARGQKGAGGRQATWDPVLLAREAYLSWRTWARSEPEAEARIAKLHGKFSMCKELMPYRQRWQELRSELLGEP